MGQQAVTETCGAAAGGTRCADCTDVACALRALASGRGGTPGAGSGQCTHRRRLGWTVRVALALRQPWVRYRLPTLLVLAVVAASGLAGGPWGVSGAMGLSLAGLLGIWWSAPRAGAARWPELALFGLACGLLATASRWAAAWPMAATSLGLACARLSASGAVYALAVAVLPWVAGRAAIGQSIGATPLMGLGLAAALGLLISERRTAWAREQRLLSALLEAGLPADSDSD